MSFTLKSVGHAFATVVHDVSVAVDFLIKHQGQINQNIAAGVAVVSFIDPAVAPLATTIARAGESLLGEALAVAHKLSDAEAQKGINVQLDYAAYQELKALLASIEKLSPGAVATAAAISASPAVPAAA